MRTASLSLASAIALSFFASTLLAPSMGCAPSTEDAETSEHAASAAEDLALAREVVALLGGEDGRCNGCHAVTASSLRAWGSQMQAIEDACFAPTDMAATARVDCLRTDPENPSSAFAARRLGLYAAGARHDSFAELFASAFPETWESELDAFRRRASMPRGNAPGLTPAEFAKVKQWVLRGMPQLDAAFQPGGGDTGECTPQTTPELAAHLASMRTAGWGARLADEATPMFGCGAATDPLECLTDLPDATETFGAPGVDQRLRRLHRQPLSSRYWVRSSADGRYVGYGMYTSAKIVDLTRPETAIRVAADYDPFFLPSNDGFAFAGSHSGNAIRVCRQSLLADVADADNPSISLTEPKCASIGRQVYQSIGSALEGGRYFVTWGAHENDDGGNDITRPLPAAFSANARTTFTPMVNDGQSYRAQRAVDVVLPREGDMMLSPSSRLGATRFGTGNKQVGYRVRFIEAEQTDSGLSVHAPLAAEICMPGSKASFSFDERFMVTHQYVDHSEPDQASLPEGSANIMIADLLTGRQVRVTSVKRGEFALYPHFRADGWLYFIVRDMNEDEEYVIASDVALRLASER